MKSAKQAKPILKHDVGRIFVAAASARALAASSLRAGLPVSTIDLFADADTVAICRKSNTHLSPNHAQNFSMQCQSIEHILQRLEQVLADPGFQDPSAPPRILIGGGLENYFRNHTTSQKLMEQTSASAFVETARWRNVKRFCRLNSVRFPPTTRELDDNQSKKGWLIKTDFSSGGLGVQIAQSDVPLKPDQYLQKYIDGRPISAHYVAAPLVESDEAPTVEMLGVCEPVSSSALQMVTRASNQTLPFRYSGSIGPIKPSLLAAPTLAEFKRVGSLVANHFGIAGIFGIDFVLDQHDLWLLEINPRITASAELIENAARETVPDFSIVRLHLEALAGRLDKMSELIEACQNANARNRIFAKRIVYRHHDAAQKFQVMPAHIGALENQFGGSTEGSELTVASRTAFITDVPKPKTDVVAGQPILTLHVSGESQLETEDSLARAFDVLETIFGMRLS